MGGVVGSSLYMQMICGADNSGGANCTLCPSSLNVLRLCSQGGDDSFIDIRVLAAQYKYVSIIIIFKRSFTSAGVQVLMNCHDD